MSRIRSPAAVPPGSRTPTASSPSASSSSWPGWSCPARSMPSKVTNRPRTARRSYQGPGGHRGARRCGSSMPALMRALVTGGSGFIGSNLVDALVERGDQVTVIDDLSTGRRENLDGAIANGAELVELDIRDAAAVAELVGRRSPRGRLPPGRPDRRARVGRRSGLRRARERGGHDQRAGGRPRGRRARAWSTPPPAAPSTARARSCRPPRTTRSRPRRPTACPSSAPRATASCSAACTGCPPSRCATATSTAPARTRSARPA